MRIASFNVENMFERAKALNLPSWDEGRLILERYTAINKLLNQATYGPADKQKIIQLLKELGLERDDYKKSDWARLRQNRGRLTKRPKSGRRPPHQGPLGDRGDPLARRR